MEQMYMIEIFVDKVSVYVTEDSSADKNLIIKIKFGPTTQFLIKEGSLIVNNDKKDDTMEITESGRKQFTRTIRVGKSYLFPSYPDTIIATLSLFPLQVEIWNDDENETEDKTFIGIGTMIWHTEFFHYLKETADPTHLHEPLTLKEVTTLYQECCCGKAGEITFILRLSALGGTITTEFQQAITDPEKFCFRTNKAPSMFECRRVEGDDRNFCMIGSLYETTTMEDPDMQNANKKIEICTEMQSCAVVGADACQHDANEPAKKRTIEKIRMGDIVGPCGNSTCPLAHKVKTYIRNLDSYKSKAAVKGSVATKPNGTDVTKKICGTCCCKDDKWHREDCPEKHPAKAECSGCGGMAKVGDTCSDRKNMHFGTGATPPTSTSATPKASSMKNEPKTQYVTSLPNLKKAMYRRDYIVENVYDTTYNIKNQEHLQNISSMGRTNTSTRTMAMNDMWVYNSSVPSYSGCAEISPDKECRCNPPIPSPPCKTFDCNCIAETFNKASRKAHKPYCPLYKHKANCPVNATDEEDVKKDEDEDEAEPLPYGLPPVTLGPCPVLGRPCSVSDGFSRMYKNALMPTQPPSFSDAGKICCSKQFQRIKTGIKEYMQYQKDHDMRCINKFNVDTERRCCDKEHVLKSLMGRECCGAHKLAIQDLYKEEKKPN